ncbi:hypothetical protein ABIC29_002757 [Agromyces sp. PvR057]
MRRAVAAHAEAQHEVAFGHAHVDGLGLEASHADRVGERERERIGGPVERDLELAPHRRTRAVGTDAVAGAHGDGAVAVIAARRQRGQDGCRGPALRRPLDQEPIEAMPPPHLTPEPAERLDEQPFIGGLLEHRDLGVRRDVASGQREVHATEFASTDARDQSRGGRAVREHAIDEAELVVELHRPGLHHERTGLPGGAGLAVDHDRVDPEPGEADGEHEPARTCADDEHVGAEVGGCIGWS